VAIISLRLLTNRRADLVRDRSRSTNRPGVRGPHALARKAEAAERQHTAVPGEAVIARPVRTLAQEVRIPNDKVAGIDRLIEALGPDPRPPPLRRAAPHQPTG
jgi:hypothetical protein